MASSQSFQIVKTTKSINEIKSIISDRLIITKDGNLYFDYNNNERITISENAATYYYNDTFIGKAGTYNNIAFKDLIIYDKYNNQYSVNKVNKGSFIFDNNNNYALCLSQTEEFCTVVILGMNVQSIVPDLNLGDKLVKNIVFANDEDNIKITNTFINPENNKESKNNIQIESSNKSLKFDLSTIDSSNMNLDVILNISKMQGNVLQLVEDGLFVSETGNVDKYIHYDLSWISKDVIPKPYITYNLYLVSPELDKYELYCSIDESKLVCIGNTGLEIVRL